MAVRCIGILIAGLPAKPYSIGALSLGRFSDSGQLQQLLPVGHEPFLPFPYLQDLRDRYGNLSGASR